MPLSTEQIEKLASESVARMNRASARAADELMAQFPVEWRQRNEAMILDLAFTMGACFASGEAALMKTIRESALQANKPT